MADEYIRRKDAIHAIMGQPPDAHYPSWYAAQIKAILAADVVPMVHGEWIHDGHHRRCNRCGTYFCNTDREGDIIPNNFCPSCGADMREVTT